MNTLSANAPKLLILGDDLSGTADCAVTSAALGLASIVRLNTESASGLPLSVDVLAIDLDCRRSSTALAARANAEAWRNLSHPHLRLYKKVDSTLRGNVAAEVAALVALAGMAIVAPAFPAAGRTTRDGRQWLHGTPVEESEVWRNEAIAGRADLNDMLAQQGLRVSVLTLANVRGNQAALLAQMQQAQADGVQALVCDSETVDDLRRVAQASAQLSAVFWVGSAGLAPELMAVLDLTATGNAPSLPMPSAYTPMLAVVGSMSSVSHAQVAALREAAGSALLVIELATASLHQAQPAFSASVIAALQQGRDVVVALRQDDRSQVADGLFFCQQLAALLVPALPYAGSVVATGGETARALLTAAAIDTLHVVDEIESGVPLLHAVHAGRTLPVITKAGGFGTPATLTSAWQRLASLHCAAPLRAQPSQEEISQ